MWTVPELVRLRMSNNQEKIVVTDQIVEKAWSNVLVKFLELEAKVEMINKRVLELQLERSESTAGIKGLNRRKRSGCSNEKDSLFKEAHESANGKLKVSLKTI